MAGIVAQLPVTLTNLFQSGREGAISGLLIIGSLGMALGLVAFICFIERAQRRVLIQYPILQTTQAIIQADRSLLPLLVIPSCLFPPFFPSSLFFLPLSFSHFSFFLLSFYCSFFFFVFFFFPFFSL